jgi:glycosyltransferase involved in cell wall biosynthesis
MKETQHLIRVANIIEEGRIGGPQKRNLMVASALDKKIDVTLIFPKENSKELQKNCVSLNVKYLTSSLTTIKRNWITILKYLIFFPFEVIMLSWILKKYCFDIVHISGGCWQYKGVFAAKLAGIKVVWELNDTYAPVITRCIFFFLSHLVNSFIFASQRTKNYYKKLVPIKCKSFLIQSPVDVNFFNPALEYPVDKFIKKTTKKKNYYWNYK